MARVDFWLFYLGFSLVMAPICLLAIYGLETASAMRVGGTLILGGVFGLLLYAFLVLFSAMARRMRDSGYARGALVGLIGGLGSAFVMVFLAAARAFDPGLPAHAQPIPQIPIAVLPAAGVGLLCTIYVFYGLIAKARPSAEAGDDATQDNASTA